MKAVTEKTIQEFLSAAEEILETVSDELLHLEQGAAEGDADPEIVNAIFRGAHSLKGLSGMFGFEDITEVSHKMESLLDGVRMGRVGLERPTLDALFEGLDVIKGIASRLSPEGPVRDPAVRPFIDRLVRLASGAPPEPEAVGLSELDLAPESLKMLTDYEVHRLEENLANAKRFPAKVLLWLPLEKLDTGMQAFQEKLKPLGELIATLPAPTSTSEDGIDFELVVAFKVPLAQASEELKPHGGEVRSLLGTKGAAAPRFVAPHAEEAPVAEPPAKAATSGQSEPPPAAAGAKPAGEAKPAGGVEGSDLRSLAKTIRVELPKLDTLMNLVGELVLTKGRLYALSERLRDQMGFSGEALELTKAHKELERRLAALQEAVMDVRMVPMGQVFSKLHLVMRKILQDTGKDVNLVIRGAETQLDKLIVEDVSDPLIHVIRNAVDHGVEPPDARVAKGKPPVATVTVSAHQRGNYVVIEVADDGAGIDVSRVREKAIRKGLMEEGQALSDKELLDFVFLPGFSTRDQVTEISGRGVGMDVLRRNIANLSGMIELQTARDQGTAVRIILPITLAIIQALLVRAGSETFAIPLNSVLETVVVDPENVRSIERRPVLKLRDQTLPLVHVSSLFGVPALSSGAPPYAVIVGIAEKRVAFGVDGLLNQRDVVIKSLGRRLKSLPGISGATDLGDQRTVLILDVAEMIEEVFRAA